VRCSPLAGLLLSGEALAEENEESGTEGQTTLGAGPPVPEVPTSPPTEVRIAGGPRGALGMSARTAVTRKDLDERLPRSAPDALRYEPGVFVQQTAHGQGSPFLRGRTGQQTVVLFDGIRMNTSTWRQGPNQYFFTLDARSIASIDVVRGGGSTVYGSDALGGVLLANPIEPTLPEAGEKTSDLPIRPRGFFRYATADSDAAERLQIDAPISAQVQAIAGVGYRRAGELKAGGNVKSPATGLPAMVPAFEADGVTQRGTGFREFTSDLRLVYRPTRHLRLIAAAYVYRQFDAPRTDQCPPPFAPLTDCLVYDEQYRTLAYTAVEADFGSFAETFSAALSFQRQHERRTRSRQTSFVQNGGRDDVNTLGVYARATTARATLGEGLRLRARYGGDAYHDSVDSTAYTRFTDIQRVIPATRGQYLNGSSYLTSGAFVEGELDLARHVLVTGGARLGLATANAPGDVETGTAPVDGSWLLPAAHLNVAVPLVRPARGRAEITSPLSVIVGVDRSIRAPNLDDLTSRQSTGPGFQFENAALGPEAQTSFEGGLRLDTRPLRAELWAFRSLVTDAITRAPRNAADCPANTSTCAASWSRYQLVNAPGTARIDGLEAALRATPHPRVTVRATFAATYGVSDNPAPRSQNPAAPYEARVPLSRIPPVNGTAEARVRLTERVYAGAALRWARAQTRLALSDRSDGRIPTGGTPGFAVVDLRAGYRHNRDFRAFFVVENLTNAAYRYHGSSINGAARGVIGGVEFGL
jgi:outer membrane receptor protein involved in Fe transport